MTYFDHNATTPVDPRVAEAMVAWLGPRYGNPSSAHRHGQAAREAVEAARGAVAALFGAQAPDVVFTASGTEANNAVVRTAFSAAAAAAVAGGGHFVLSAFEHPSIEAAATERAAAGVEVDRVPPRRDGRVDPEEMLARVRPDTRLVALMLANNELGTLQPVAKVAARCGERGVAVLCDAVQAAGKVQLDVRALGVDFLTIGAHKFHGPLGAAALWLRPGSPFVPFLVGGAQERRRRAGTENVPAIVGLGRAAELAASELHDRARHLQSLRDRFEDHVLERVPGAVVHCASSPRLPNTSSVRFAGVDAQALLIRLDLLGWSVSTGAACASGVVAPSRTLAALGLSAAAAGSTLRVSFGMTNTAAEVDAFVPVLAREVATLRGGRVGRAARAAAGVASRSVA
jgi:cysteine desulfurase